MELCESEKDAPMYVPFIMSENLNLDEIGHLLAGPDYKDPQLNKTYKQYIKRDD